MISKSWIVIVLYFLRLLNSEEVDVPSQITTVFDFTAITNDEADYAGFIVIQIGDYLYAVWVYEHSSGDYGFEEIMISQLSLDGELIVEELALYEVD